MNSLSQREKLISYAEKQYHCTAEYPWSLLPDYAVLRHDENQKWFALFMTVKKEKLGIPEDGYLDILNLKVENGFDEILIRQKGFLPPYHLKRGGWITIILDGTVDLKEIKNLLEMSYNLTLPKNKITNPAYRNTKWIVPANPKYYDISEVIRSSQDGTFIWKQSNRILAGDTVYLYVAAPVSAICYRCTAIEVNIPYEYADENVRMSHVMKLKIRQTYDEKQIPYAMLKKYGVNTIRGPRSMPVQLEKAIQELYGKQ